MKKIIFLTICLLTIFYRTNCMMSLHTACKTGNLDAIEVMVDPQYGSTFQLSSEKFFTKVNAPDSCGRTPLLLACYSRNPKLVKLLLEEGARYSIDIAEEKHFFGLLDSCGKKYIERYTPLLFACEKHDLQIVKILLEKGANINAYSQKGITPLLAVCCKTHKKDNLEENDLKIVKLLLENGADVNTHDKHGNTPILFACHKNKYKIIKLLLKHGAKVNTPKTQSEWTPLHWACCNKNSEIALLLLKSGADVNAADEQRHTPLWTACRSNNYEIGKILVENGALVTDKELESTQNSSLSEYSEHILKNYLQDIHTLQNAKNKLESVVDQLCEKPSHTKGAKDIVRYVFCTSLVNTLKKKNYLYENNYFETTLFTQLCKASKNFPNIKDTILQALHIDKDDDTLLEPENRTNLIAHISKQKDFCFKTSKLREYCYFLEDRKARRTFVSSLFEISNKTTIVPSFGKIIRTTKALLTPS